MTPWNDNDLHVIAETKNLFVSPFREDGSTFGTPTRVWPLVVDGDVYVRAANGQQSKWYQAAISQGAGRIRVVDQEHDVTFEPASGAVSDAVDSAYEDKYPGSSAVPTMQGEGPGRRRCGSCLGDRIVLRRSGIARTPSHVRQSTRTARRFD